MTHAYVLGGSGYVGSAISNELIRNDIQTTSIGRHCPEIKFDLANPDMAALVNVEEGALVIVASAISSPDACEKKYDDAYQVNVIGTYAFISYMLDRKCRVLFLSSDAVFSSEPGIIFDENSPTRPRFAYGKMKEEIERHFAGDSLFKTMRLSYVFSDHDKSTQYMFDCLKSGQCAEIYHPYYRNYISLSDVTRAVCWLLFHWETFPNWKLNLAGTELVSRVRAADEFKQLFPGFRYTICQPPASFYSSRPSVTQIASNYLYDLGICERRPFSTSFRSEMKGWIQND